MSNGLYRYKKEENSVGRVSSLFLFFCSCVGSERQVVRRVAAQEFWSCGRSGRRSGHVVSWSCGRSCGAHTFYLPCTDTVEPAVLPLTRVDVERNGQFFAHLDIELFDLVGSEHIEAHFAWILVVIFDDIFLHFPLVASFGRTASWLQYGNNFSCKFHCNCSIFWFLMGRSYAFLGK